jgi:hypothetical protein
MELSSYTLPSGNRYEYDKEIFYKEFEEKCDAGKIYDLDQCMNEALDYYIQETNEKKRYSLFYMTCIDLIFH